MRKVKKIILFLTIFTIAFLIKNNAVFAEYVIQVVPNATAWKTITVSDAYDACQNLNQPYSTLGTTSLKAHLTTNADYYAVSLLTYSSYGNRNKSNTTGNRTGIMNFGTSSTFTSSLMDGYQNSTYTKSLRENIETPYVEKVKNYTDRAANASGLGLLGKEVISTSYGSIEYASNNNTWCPVVVRSNLFGIRVAHSWEGCQGESHASVTFRPVIWNR